MPCSRTQMRRVRECLFSRSFLLRVLAFSGPGREIREDGWNRMLPRLGRKRSDGGHRARVARMRAESGDRRGSVLWLHVNSVHAFSQPSEQFVADCAGLLSHEFGSQRVAVMRTVEEHFSAYADSWQVGDVD